MSNPFHYSELLYPLTKGDTAGHPFHGNQFTAGQGGGAKDTADKIMDAVNKYGDENPNAQMNKGWQTVMEQAKMIGEHKMAIPKALVDSATKEDLDKLTDNNYHSARTAIEQQRPDLLTPSAREVNLGNYFKSESLLYPLSKGDVAGHAFHGNQYQQGAISALRSQAISALRSQASFHAGKATLKNPNFKNTDGRNEGTYYGKISHDETAKILGSIADKIQNDPKPLSEHLQDLKDMKSGNATKLLADSQQDVFSPRGHAQQDAINRAIGIIEPMASKEAESLLYPLTKGDTPGHEFHGNQYQAGQGGGGNLTPSGHRPLNEIAYDIEKVWNANSKNGVPYFAKPYLDAMKQLHDIKDNYYADSAKSIVNYLLANMGTFRGEGTAPLRAELKTLVK